MLAKKVKAWHRRRCVGPQTERASQLSRAKTCTGWALHWLHSHTQPARWINSGSFAKACHGKSFYSDFLLFLQQQRAHKYNSLTKKSRAYPLRSTTSDRQKARVKRKNVCKSKAWRDSVNLKAHIASRAFPCQIPERGRFFEGCFQPLSVGGCFSNQRESISRWPKSPFPSKTQNRQIARTFPLKPWAQNFKKNWTPKIISSDVRECFRRIRWWRSEVEIRTGRRSNRRRKNWHLRAFVTAWCHVHTGATSQSCKVTRLIQNNRDQPESARDMMLTRWWLRSSSCSSSWRSAVMMLQFEPSRGNFRNFLVLVGFL